MGEREEPDLDRVREAMREHDERVESDQPPPEGPPEDEPQDRDDDEED